MSDEAIAVLTGKSVTTLLAEGGSGDWLLNAGNARRRGYVVCVRNEKTEEPGSKERHGTAFLVGRIKGLIPLPPVRGRERWRIGISEYALIEMPDVWRGWRNPVIYTSLEDLGIDARKLIFEPAPEPSVPEATPMAMPHRSVQPLTIPEAKAGLALTLGISPDAIEITIKG